MSENELNGEKGIRLCRLIYVCFGLAAAFALYASGCAMWIEFGAASTAKYLAAALLAVLRRLEQGYLGAVADRSEVGRDLDALLSAAEGRAEKLRLARRLCDALGISLEEY